MYELVCIKWGVLVWFGFGWNLECDISDKMKFFK